MNWQLLLNPFTKFSEKALLFFGIITFFIGSYVAFLCGATFDGLIDVHLNSELTFFDSLKENCFHLVLITLLLFVFGKIINPRTRFIDILNAGFLFRIPFYFMALLMTFPFLKSFENEVQKNINSLEKLVIKPFDLVMILVLSCFLILLLVYAITLLFQGFKTATNAKKPIHFVVFGLLILFAEILSKTILPLI